MWVILRRVLRLLVTDNLVPSSPMLVTLRMEMTVSPKYRFLQEPHGDPRKRYSSSGSLSYLLLPYRARLYVVGVQDLFGRRQTVRAQADTSAAIYCDAFSRIPSLLCNTLVDPRQPLVEYFDRYAHHPGTVVLHGNQQQEGSVFNLGRPGVI
jgi:hypothetical protein